MGGCAKKNCAGQGSRNDAISNEDWIITDLLFFIFFCVFFPSVLYQNLSVALSINNWNGISFLKGSNHMWCHHFQVLFCAKLSYSQLFDIPLMVLCPAVFVSYECLSLNDNWRPTLTFTH